MFIRRSRKTCSKRLMAVLAVVMCGLVLTACGSGDPGSGKKTLKVGFLYDAHAANVWTMDRCQGDVSFELVNFKQFAEVQRAFEAGQIDLAAMGYQNLAQMIGNNFTDFKAVAGVYTGAEHITVRKGSGITKWTDLAGKKVGIPPNSFVEMLFRAGAEENGLDLSKVEIVPFPGAGPPMLAALQKGDIDAMVAWEPNSARAAVEGYGEYPPFDIQEGAIGKATSLMYASGKVLKSSPDAVQAAVNCLKERTEALNADTETWKSLLVSKTGLSEPIADQAIKTGTMDINLYQESGQRIIKEFAKNGLVKDVSDQVPSMFDYTFLEKATGKVKSELGAA